MCGTHTHSRPCPCPKIAPARRTADAHQRSNALQPRPPVHGGRQHPNRSDREARPRTFCPHATSVLAMWRRFKRHQLHGRFTRRAAVLLQAPTVRRLLPPPIQLAHPTGMPGHLWHVPTASNAASNAAAAAATLAKHPATAESALAPATAESAPTKLAAPNRAPGFAPANDLPRHLRHRRRHSLPGRRLESLRVDVRVRYRLQRLRLPSASRPAAQPASDPSATAANAAATAAPRSLPAQPPRSCLPRRSLWC